MGSKVPQKIPERLKGQKPRAPATVPKNIPVVKLICPHCGKQL